MSYIKTTAGNDALQQRSKLLSAKQRQLLFVLGTEAFDKLPEASQQRMLQPELIESLLSLGFIEEQLPEPEIETVEEIKPENITPVATVSNILSQVINRYAQPQPKPTLAEEIADEQEEADFKLNTAPAPSLNLARNLPTMQNMMIEALQQYSGLMSKGLIEKIRQCQSAEELKRCHMAWVTVMQETRLPAQHLHSQVKQLQKFYQFPEISESETHI
ncbi:hypothetical protein [Acinetobacter sp. MB5]|uniref:hypothetical protein n=1 Tax=Acinetobacter sp. MB5 TaxID=2069438 RepID=UPI000DD016AA|nr:hypothetical protein [Acinetobacter sp. MB5]